MNIFSEFVDRMLMNGRSLATISFVFLLTIASASAEPSLESAGDELQAEKVKTVSAAMQLDAKQAKLFWPLYKSYQDDIRKLGEDRLRLADDAAKAEPALSDARAVELIRQALAIEEKRLSLKRRHVALFLEKLPPKIVIRYFQLENKFQSQVDAQLAARLPLVADPSHTP